MAMTLSCFAKQVASKSSFFKLQEFNPQISMIFSWTLKLGL